MIYAFSIPILPISDMGLYFSEKKQPPPTPPEVRYYFLKVFLAELGIINDSYEEINNFEEKHKKYDS